MGSFTEALLMSTHKIYFYGEIRKLIQTHHQVLLLNKSSVVSMLSLSLCLSLSLSLSLTWKKIPQAPCSLFLQPFFLSISVVWSRFGGQFIIWPYRLSEYFQVKCIHLFRYQKVYLWVEISKQKLNQSTNSTGGLIECRPRKYSQTSMAWTSLVPWKFGRDMGVEPLRFNHSTSSGSK